LILLGENENELKKSTARHIAVLTKYVVQPYVPGCNEYTETTYFEHSSDFPVSLKSNNIGNAG